MTEEYLHDIEAAGVTDILWSNRGFPEYGVPVFGTDVDAPVGDYIRRNYVRAGDIPPVGPGTWGAEIWRRKARTGGNN
jgi:hypothetical protein